MTDIQYDIMTIYEQSDKMTIICCNEI